MQKSLSYNYHTTYLTYIESRLYDLQAIDIHNNVTYISVSRSPTHTLLVIEVVWIACRQKSDYNIIENSSTTWSKSSKKKKIMQVCVPHVACSCKVLDKNQFIFCYFFFDNTESVTSELPVMEIISLFCTQLQIY